VTPRLHSKVRFLRWLISAMAGPRKAGDHCTLAPPPGTRSIRHGSSRAGACAEHAAVCGRGSSRGRESHDLAEDRLPSGARTAAVEAGGGGACGPVTPSAGPTNGLLPGPGTAEVFPIKGGLKKGKQGCQAGMPLRLRALGGPQFWRGRRFQGDSGGQGTQRHHTIWIGVLAQRSATRSWLWGWRPSALASSTGPVHGGEGWCSAARPHQTRCFQGSSFTQVGPSAGSDPMAPILITTKRTTAPTVGKTGQQFSSFPLPGGRAATQTK